MDDMASTLEAIQLLPEEYQLKINKHFIAGDSESLEKALNTALHFSQNLDSLDKLNTSQKELSKTLLTIRAGLAAELLNLEGFDFEAAKNRGKAETAKTDGEPKKHWSKAAVAGVERT